LVKHYKEEASEGLTEQCVDQNAAVALQKLKGAPSKCYFACINYQYHSW